MSDQDTSWRSREDERFLSGRYKRLPWNDHPMWRSPAFVTIWYEQFPHICINNPQLISYTQSAEKGMRDIQTPIKPGRYLQKYFGHLLSEEEIRNWVNWFKTGFEPTPFDNLPLKFATTPDEIEQVYDSPGPNSCMTKMAAVRVYGAGDLAIAYLEDPDIQNGILARAICWPKKRLFGRIYPEAYRTSQTGLKGIALQQALWKAGYERAYRSMHEKSFHGARLLKIPSEEYRNNYLMPYIDDAEGVDDSGTYFTLHVGPEPEYVTKDTTGFLLAIEEEGTFTCENCEETFREEDSYANTVYVSLSYRTANWCDHCLRHNAFYCELSEEHYSLDRFDSVECVETQHHSFYAEMSVAIRNNYYECAITGRYYLEENFPPHILVNPDPDGDPLWVSPIVSWEMVEEDMTIPTS